MYIKVNIQPCGAWGCGVMLATVTSTPASGGDRTSPYMYGGVGGFSLFTVIWEKHEWDLELMQYRYKQTPKYLVLRSLQLHWQNVISMWPQCISSLNGGVWRSDPSCTAVCTWGSGKDAMELSEVRDDEGDGGSVFTWKTAMYTHIETITHQ